MNIGLDGFFHSGYLPVTRRGDSFAYAEGARAEFSERMFRNDLYAGTDYQSR